MGVTNVTLKSFNETIKKEFEGELVGQVIYELGDQQIYIQGKEQVLFKTYPYFDLTEFKSIDWHGNNGVLKLDFREEMPKELIGRADILTNFGFTEHVTNQYMAWKNIHELLKVDGICISELPGMVNFPGHLDCPYYTEQFFNVLALENGYEILELRYQKHEIPLKGQVCWCVFKKVMDVEFSRKEHFELIESKLRYNEVCHVQK